MDIIQKRKNVLSLYHTKHIGKVLIEKQSKECISRIY